MKIIISMFLAFAGVLPMLGMKYQIKVLNTPSILIDGKAEYVGSWIDDNSVITWESEQQAMRVLSADNRVYTVSGKSYKANNATRFRDCLIYKDDNSVRGVSGWKKEIKDRIEMGAPFVMLDQASIDLSGIKELPECLKWNAKLKGDKNDILIPLTFENQNLSMLRSLIEPFIADNRQLEYLVIDEEGNIITSFFEIEILPIELVRED